MELQHDVEVHRIANQPRLVATGVSKTPANVKVHNYYTENSATRTLVNAFTFGIDGILYGLVNDSKILGTSAVNGPQHSTDLAGNKVGEKERVMAFTNVGLTLLSEGIGAQLKGGSAGVSGLNDARGGSSFDVNVKGNPDNPMNCAGCTIAGDATLKGYPAVALDHKDIPVGDFFNWFSPEDPLYFENPSGIKSLMHELGDGATGVIYGNRPGKDAVGHFFNVFKKEGKVFFWDFQKQGTQQFVNPNTVMKKEGFDFLLFRIQQIYIKNMITKDDAIKIFNDYLANKALGTKLNLVPLIDSTIEFEYGWVFFHQSKKYLETLNVMDKLTGNVPVIINKYDGSITFTGSAHPVKTYLKEYIGKMKKDNEDSH